MKTDSDILFSKIRSVALKYGKAKQYKAWLKSTQPERDFHHVFGSSMSLKSTDWLAVMVTREDHVINQDNKDWLIHQIPIAIDNLLLYITEKGENEKNKT